MTETTHDRTTDDNPKTIVVTGASSGIGEATARRLAAEGHHVVATARRTERLTRIAAEVTAAGHSLQARPLDVTDAEAFRSLVDSVAAEHGSVDVLVGNAGAMLLSRLESLLVDEWDRMIDVNIRGLLHGFAAVLPHFERQERGHVVTVASVGAHEVVETSAVYSATKFAAWALTEGLRLEADPSIRVTTISPGVVETELADHISDPYASKMMGSYRSTTMSPAVIAGAISYAIGQPADVDVNEIVVRPTRQR